MVGVRAAVQYMEVDKVGRTTGWTYGYVDTVCMDMVLTYSETPPFTAKLICQDMATYSTDGGDSGAPVMFWKWGGDFSVSHVDIVGVNHSKWGEKAGYSPWAQVSADLGSLYL